MSRPDARKILDTDLYGITGEQFSRGRNTIEVVRKMIFAGIKVIQYREKEKKMRQKYEQCLELRRLTRAAGVALIIDDDVDLAISVQADGVHVGQEDLPVSAVRSLVGETMMIGLSTHSPEQAREAVNEGADYIGVGPIFSTRTKSDVVPAVGLSCLEYVARNVPLPFVAIGGIKEHNIKEVRRRGGRCIAMVTEILEADDIIAKVHALRDTLSAAR